MPWKFESDRPIYAQILEQIKERIIAGEYPPGSKLPSVRELATEAAVNPNTMQRAMAELEREGYVVTNRTTGRTVTDNVGVIMESKKSTAIELTQKYIEKMEQLGFSKEQIVEATVSIRLVDVATGMIVFSGEAQGQASTEDKQVLGLGSTADYDATLSDKAISAAISKLVENIINKCMDNPWRAYLLSYDDGVYFVSGGASQGIAAGDRFAVVERGKQVKNPQTGLLVELPGKTVGEIRIDQTLGSTVADEISMATLTDGELDNETLEKYYITEM